MPRRTTSALPNDLAAAFDQLAADADPTLVARATAYRPRFPEPSWPHAAPLVALGVLAAAPTSTQKTPVTARWCTIHVTACLDRGASRTVTGVWGPDAVETTLATLEVSEHMRAGLATTLRRVSRALVPRPRPPAPRTQPRRQPLEPYTTGELADLVEAASTIGPPVLRVRTCLLIALHAGVGLRAQDLDGFDPTRVVLDDHGVLVSSPGGRVVPARTELEQLAAAALHAWAPDGTVCNPLPARYPSSNIFERTPWPHGLPRPSAARLRATWTVWVLAGGASLQAFLAAAHITSTDSWYAPVRLLADLPKQEYLHQVRGTTSPFVPGARRLDGQPWPAPAVPLRTDAQQAGGDR